MSSNPLDDRKLALEAYFDQQDRQLVEQMRNKLAAQEREAELSAATGVTDRLILTDLVKESDIGALAALGLIPMVAVAWADGRIAPNEYSVALKAAATMGVPQGSQSFALLEKWLQTRPSPGIVSAWKAYVKALVKTWPPERARTIKRAILGRATSVAQSAGGILGLGNKVSAKEQAVLDDLESAFGV
jgi:hypothetical protein